MEHLRRERAWSQKRMAEFLGLAQSAVFRMENGQAETGPVSRLLDVLERSDPAALMPPEGPMPVAVGVRVDEVNVAAPEAPHAAE